MGLLFMVVAGAVFGWLASVICRVETSRGVLIEIFGEPSLLTGTYNVSAVLMTLVGAALFVALLNLLRPADLR